MRIRTTEEQLFFKWSPMQILYHWLLPFMHSISFFQIAGSERLNHVELMATMALINQSFPKGVSVGVVRG